MFKVKVLSMIGLIIILFGFMGCQSYKREELYIVPHSINAKSYGSNTSTTLYFVSNKDIPYVRDIRLSYDFDIYSSLESFEFGKFSKVEKYKDYYIYRIDFDIIDFVGDVDIYEIQFRSESGILYRFNTNVYISTDHRKDNHIYSGEDGMALTYYQYRDGIELTLKPEKEMYLKEIYFEGESSMNLSDYILSVKINDKVLDEVVFIDTKEVFTLDIEFSSLDEWHGYIVDILVASFINDESELSSAYIGVSFLFGSPVLTSRDFIDMTWDQ